MADTSLQALTQSIQGIAKSQDSIEKDVAAIRKAVCGSEGIKGLLESFMQKMDKDFKITQLSRIGGNSKSSDIQKKLIKSTDSISKTLGKILDKMDQGGSLGRINLKGLDDVEKDNGKNKSLNSTLDTIKKLSKISLRDFRQAKKKLNFVDKITEKSIAIFNKFKDDKEIDKTIEFINKSVGLVEDLAKINKNSKKARNGVKSLNELYFGNRFHKGGLLELFVSLSKHKDDIEKGKKALSGLAVAAGSMLVLTLCLSGLVISVIPAMVGTLAFIALTWVLSKTFKWLGKATPSVVKGSIAIAVLCAGIILFAAGITKLSKAIKGLTLKDIGLMAASIAGIGLAVAGVGLLSVPIIAGGASLLIIGASLGIFALSLLAWKNFDSKSAIGNVKTAVTGLQDALGIGKKPDYKKGRKEALKGGLADMIMNLFDMGKSFATMASILVASVVLGLVRLTLKSWENFDGSRAIGNMGKALTGFKKELGLKDANNEKIDGRGLGQKGMTTIADGLDFVSSIFKMGQTFSQLGSILFASVVMLIVKSTIEKWKDNSNVDTAITNMCDAIGSLKTALGLNANESEKITVGGLLSQTGGTISDILGFASSVLQFGKMFFQMGSILLAIGIMGYVRKKLDEWKEYDSSDPIENIKTTLRDLKDAFGLQDRDNNDTILDFGKNILGSIGDILAFGSSILQFGKTFFQIGSIFLGMGMMNVIRDNLDKWNDYDSSNAIGNIKNTVTGLKEAFGLLNEKEAEAEKAAENATEKKAKWYENVWEGIKNAGKKVANIASGIEHGIKSMAKLAALVEFTAVMDDIKEYISPYDDYNPSQAISNISTGVTDLLNAIKESDGGIKKSAAFKTSSSNIKAGLDFLKSGFNKLNTIKESVVPVDKTVKSINMLDLEKASMLTEMFKSFAKIGNKPFNKFTDAVNKFVKSCGDLIESMDRLSSSNEAEQGTPEGSTTTETESISTKKKGIVSIENTKALADAIAEAMRSIPINVESSMSDIKLVVDGSSSRRVVLTLDN